MALSHAELSAQPLCHGDLRAFYNTRCVRLCQLDSSAVLIPCARAAHCPKQDQPCTSVHVGHNMASFRSCANLSIGVQYKPDVDDSKGFAGVESACWVLLMHAAAIG